MNNEKFYATSKYAKFRNSSPFQIPFHNNIAIFFHIIYLKKKTLN